MDGTFTSGLFFCDFILLVDIGGAGFFISVNSNSALGSRLNQARDAEATGNRIDLARKLYWKRRWSN